MCKYTYKHGTRNIPEAFYLCPLKTVQANPSFLDRQGSCTDGWSELWFLLKTQHLSLPVSLLQLLFFLKATITGEFLDVCDSMDIKSSKLLNYCNCIILWTEGRKVTNTPAQTKNWKRQICSGGACRGCLESKKPFVSSRGCIQYLYPFAFAFESQDITTSWNWAHSYRKSLGIRPWL